ncbi:MAG: aldo/keto reductase [Porticoccaceae bacterium]
MVEISARAAGTFMLGGDIEVSRLGYGTLHLIGENSWGPPQDAAEARRILRRLPELGVNLIDTADSYGPDIAEQLIREVLHPYSDRNIVVATKAGVVRPEPEQWVPLGRPEYLIQQVHKSLRALDIERIDLWQLHRLDPRVPAEEQFDAIKSLISDGLVRHAGLSEVGVDDVKLASRYFKVASVQNLYNLIDRTHEAVLDYCEAHGIAFIPWFPLASGELARKSGLLEELAKKYDASVSQIALAWVLKRSPVMLPIPGTSRVAHLEQNVQAGSIKLSDADFIALDEAGRREFSSKNVIQK